jgi:hypothetical protein
MYECPWCEQKSFSFFDKQTLGPSRTIKCGECKRKVGVPGERAQIAAAPLFLLGFLGLLMGKYLYGTWPAVLLGGWVGITLGMAISASIYHLYVPLERET